MLKQKIFPTNGNRYFLKQRDTFNRKERKKPCIKRDNMLYISYICLYTRIQITSFLLIT